MNRSRMQRVEWPHPRVEVLPIPNRDGSHLLGIMEEICSQHQMNDYPWNFPLPVDPSVSIRAIDLDTQLTGR